MTYIPTRWDPPEKRFWGRVDKAHPSGCWVWTGTIGRKGYGNTVKFAGMATTPHRISYVIANGPIPEGLVIDHLCRNRACVNPDHLEPVTAIENTKRGAQARWSEPCPNGHDPSFRRELAKGAFCVQCRRESDARRYARNGAERRAKARERYRTNGRPDRKEVKPE